MPAAGASLRRPAAGSGSGLACRAQRDDLGAGAGVAPCLARQIDARDHRLAPPEGEHLRGRGRGGAPCQHLLAIEPAHQPVILGQVRLDRAGGHQLVVHALDRAPFCGIGPAPGERRGRDAHHREQGRRAEPRLRREHPRLVDGAREHGGEAQMREADHAGDDAPPQRVEPACGVHHAAPDIVVRDQLLVVGIGELGAAADQLDEPVGPGADLDLDVAVLARAEGAERIVAPPDAPFRRAVDVVLGLRLGGVEGLQRVHEVVAQHARAVDCRRPVLDLQRLHHVAVPANRLRGRPAPEAVAGVQHVVAEVLELLVRRRGPFQIEPAMPEEKTLPQIGVGALEVAQRIERQLVMRGPGVGGVDDMEKRVHGAFSPWAGPARPQRR